MINEKNKFILKTNENSINLATQSDCEIRNERLNNKLQRTSNELEEISSLYAKSVRDSLEKSRKIKELEDETEELADQLKASENNKELEKQLEDSENTKKELEKQLQDMEAIQEELAKQLKDCQEKSRSNDDDDDLVITSDDKVAKFIMEVLDKAIPYSARIVNCVSNGKYIINKDAEISNTIPSTLLLRQKEKSTLLLKIMQEVLMTKFWNGNNKLYGLYSAWAMNTLDYGPKGNGGVNKRLFPKTTIKNHGDNSIIWTRMLFNSKNQLYFDEVFNIIEKYLQKHGVNCNVEKAFNPSHGRIWDSQKVLVSHGSLPFPKVKINGVSSDSPYYYLQVSFNIKMKLNNKSYPIRGYTMLLSDALDLYKIKGGDVIEPDDENKTIIDEFI